MQTANDPVTHGLRVLVANERRDRLDELARVVRLAGHEVAAETVDVANAGVLTRQQDPDVAFVAVGATVDHALEQIESIAEDASCPVIIVLDENDPSFVAEAARRGAFGYALDTTPEELQSSIEIALRRFADFHELEQAFKRRALIERAKGVLMERHGIGEQQAFERLRSHARKTQTRMVAIAEALLTSLELLPATADQPMKRDETIGATDPVVAETQHAGRPMA